MATEEAKQWVLAKLKEKQVVVFSKSYCPFCTKAKNALKGLCDDYLCIEIEDLPNCDAIQNALHEITGARTVPRVFVDGTCIGGGDETAKAKASGQLAKMLKK